MARNVRPEPLVELDLNSPVFQSAWSDLELVEQEKAFATFIFTEEYLQIRFKKGKSPCQRSVPGYR